ncbi:hypothetical protein LTS17_011039 [Exophiala oligosperma]
MFGSNASPLPPPLAHEHRPLRLTSESVRPLPTGGCRYILLHPSAQNQPCSCQSFHHNRNAPGNICECGHQACYHVHERHATETYAILEKFGEKVRRLEETIQNERTNRENALTRERQMWEREIRILREALAPFYQSEKEMRRKTADLEDRVEGTYDEQVRLQGRVVAIDDATLSIAKRVEELEGLRSKRRRVARISGPEEQSPAASEHASPDTIATRRVSSGIDERSVHTPSSRALSPSGAISGSTEAEEPRSSGILNLVEIPRSAPFNINGRLSPPNDEPRSSGFLNLDLAERLHQKTVSDPTQTVFQHHVAARITPPQDRPSPPGYAESNPELVRPVLLPPDNTAKKIPLIDVMVLPVNTSPRKRKHHLDHIALDVLADVSMASPLIH